MSGGARRQGREGLVAGDAIDGRSFIELDDAATVAVKHTETGRELLFTGPALALPCRRGEEQVLLADGRFESTAGAGVRPGAEVLVATPAGVIRYGDAQIEVEAHGRRVTVQARSGEARVEPAAHATVAGGPVIHAPKGSARLVAGAEATPDSLTQGCREASAKAADAARDVLSSGADGGSLGARAAAQLRARQVARSACAVAAAAVAGVKDPAQRAGLWARVEHSDRVWRAIRSEASGPIGP